MTLTDSDIADAIASGKLVLKTIASGKLVLKRRIVLVPLVTNFEWDTSTTI